MLIDVSRPETFPAELKREIELYLSNMSQEIVDTITSNEIEYSIDVRCSIEDYVGIFKAESLYKQLLEILGKHSLVCYHSTRILDKNSLYRTGLIAHDLDSYCKMLRETLTMVGAKSDEIEEIIEIAQKEYHRKYINREPQLCFYSGLSLLAEEGESAGYEQFCENVGGELIRWPLKQNRPNLYQYLKGAGEGIIVKFELPFSQIAEYQKDTIAFQFISYIAAQYFWNFKYEIEFDGMTRTNILPEQILELIPYTREIDY